MVVYETQYLKTMEWPKKKKTITLRCGLIRKIPISEVSEFSSLPKYLIPKIENSETWEICLSLRSLVVYETQDLKTKKMAEDKKN